MSMTVEETYARIAIQEKAREAWQATHRAKVDAALDLAFLVGERVRGEGRITYDGILPDLVEAYTAAREAEKVARVEYMGEGK